MDIKEFDALSEDQQLAMINSLKMYDQVQLISTDGSINTEQASRVHKKLANALLNVRESIIHENTKIEDLVVFAANVLHSETIKCSSTFVTSSDISKEQKEIFAKAGIDLKTVEKAKVHISVPGIKTQKIDEIPSIVNLADLRDGKLLSEKTINKIKLAIDSDRIPNTSARLTKEALKKAGISSRHEVIFIKNKDGSYRLFAVYGGKNLGEGQTAVTNIVQDLSTGKYYVAKTREHPRDRSALLKMKKEKDNLALAGELVESLDYSAPKLLGTQTFNSPHTVMLIELAPGQELKHIRAAKPLTDLEYVKLAIDLAKEIRSLHSKGLIHADINPDNVMFSHSSVKLIDFGESVKGDPKKDTLDLARGTMQYFPPEFTLNAMVKFSEKTDLYSFAITIAVMMGLAEIKKDAKNGEFSLISASSQKFKDNTTIKDPAIRAQFLDCLSQMTQADPAARPTMDKAIESLESVFNNLQLSSTRVMQVGILDLKEFEKADEYARQELMAKLLKYNAVKVIWSGEKLDSIKAQQFMHMLTAVGIKVDSQITYGDQSVSSLISRMQAEDKTGLNQKYTLVTGKVATKETEAELSKANVSVEKTRTAEIAQERIQQMRTSASSRFFGQIKTNKRKAIG